MVFEYSTRVYFSDTDAGGIVYHTHYLDWAEHARTEMLRSILPDMAQSQIGEMGFFFVVKSINIEYFSPAILDDLITVHTSIEKLDNFSTVLKQEVRRNNTLLANIDVKLAFISKETGRPQRLPDDLRSAFLS